MAKDLESVILDKLGKIPSDVSKLFSLCFRISIKPSTIVICSTEKATTFTQCAKMCRRWLRKSWRKCHQRSSSIRQDFSIFKNKHGMYNNSIICRKKKSTERSPGNRANSARSQMLETGQWHERVRRLRALEKVALQAARPIVQRHSNRQPRCWTM